MMTRAARWAMMGVLVVGLAGCGDKPAPTPTAADGPAAGKGGFPGMGGPPGGKGGFPGGMMGGPPGGMMGGFQPPKPGEVLPGFLRDQLKLTDDQKTKLDALQADVRTKLDAILTADQQAELKKLGEAGPGGMMGGFPGGPKGPQ